MTDCHDSVLSITVQFCLLFGGLRPLFIIFPILAYTAWLVGSGIILSITDSVFIRMNSSIPVVTVPREQIPIPT